jgi:ABC-type multidrug transport system ATPase subunit
VSVRLKNITKLYGRFAALRGVSHEFRPGTLSAVIGDNGAGKSTLLRIIAGLIQPTSGTRETNGPIGYMAHASMLYDELTGLENLRYFAALHKFDNDARLRDLLATVDLDPTLTKLAREYSQGMRQRLSLARSVVHDPEIVLLDEPFSNVDAESVSHIVRVLSQWREAGKTIVLVTHQPGVLERTADEFITMSNGLVIEQRHMREVLA